MAESRLQRWSRKKAEAGKESELAPPSAAASEPSPEEQELAINEALPEQGVLEKYALPDPDTIELGTDITGFMRKEIPELLRRKALRALWKSNPVLAVLDGLNDYDEDFSDAAAAVSGVVKTLYKVGQGFDRSIMVDEPVAEQAPEQVEQQTGAQQDEAPATVVPDTAVDGVTKVLAPASAVESPTNIRHFEPLVSPGEVRKAEASRARVTEVEPPPRYRPRMQFE